MLAANDRARVSPNNFAVPRAFAIQTVMGHVHPGHFCIGVHGKWIICNTVK